MEKYKLKIPKMIIKDLEKYDKVTYRGTEFDKELLELNNKEFDLAKKV